MNSTLVVGLLSAMTLAATAGYWWGRQDSPQGEPSATSEAPAERPVLYWYDPMKPDQHFDKPGPSPFMDMQLVPKYAGAGEDSSALSVMPQAVQSLGMRTARVLRGALPSAIEAVGSLAYNQRQVATLQARAAGFVERVYGHAAGDVLPAGTPLADLLIPEWAAAQLEFIAVLHSADARLIAAARQRLHLLGMPEALIARVQRSGQASALHTVVTPIAGELLAVEVRAGMRVAEGQDLARSNGLATVWLDTALPEAQAAQVQPGAEVSAELEAFPGQLWQGRVIALLPSTDMQTRTLTVRSELANPDGRLRPGMFARVRLQEAEAQPSLLVPSEAVIRTGKRALVMLAEPDGRYRPQLVQLGREAAGKIEVLAGLSEGQDVVSSGQFLLDSEASLQGLLVRGSDQAPEDEGLHEAEGLIRELDEQHVRLEHGPFASLGMPGMTMQFPLANPQVAAGLQVGDRVRIAVQLDESGMRVERLRKLEDGQ